LTQEVAPIKENEKEKPNTAPFFGGAADGRVPGGN